MPKSLITTPDAVPKWRCVDSLLLENLSKMRRMKKQKEIYRICAAPHNQVGIGRVNCLSSHHSRLQNTQMNIGWRGGIRLETSEGTVNGAGLTVMPLYTSFRDTKLLNHLSERHALRSAIEREIGAGNRGG